MTDKQVIIDRVDVSGCEKQGETIAGITCGNGERIRLANEIITKHKLCKDNPNCVYKQLKRKEQECDPLKVQLLDQKVKTLKDSGIICVLKQTLTEIKKIAKNMNNECFYSDFDCKDCDMKNGCTYHRKIKILQKISECEAKNER